MISCAKIKIPALPSSAWPLPVGKAPSPSLLIRNSTFTPPISRLSQLYPVLIKGSLSGSLMAVSMRTQLLLLLDLLADAVWFDL